MMFFLGVGCCLAYLVVGAITGGLWFSLSMGDELDTAIFAGVLWPIIWVYVVLCVLCGFVVAFGQGVGKLLASFKGRKMSKAEYLTWREKLKKGTP